MKSILVLPAIVCLALASQDTQLQNELRRIDAWAADPDARLVMISAMADTLNVHRNHLILLRKQTGDPYSRIFVSTLEKSGASPAAILARAVALNRETERRLHPASADGEPAGAGTLRPILSVGAGADRNSAGAFYWLAPEVGIDSRHASVSFSVPYYRNSGDTSAAGLGDAYAVATLRGRAAGAELETALTVGFPTGDQNRGLGAGKATVDIAGTVAHDFERVRPFLSAGFANSMFNFAYQRPFIADGNAAHFAAGLECRAVRRLTAGFGGFAVRPFGSQTVYSRIVVGQQAATGTSAPGAGTGHMPGGMPSAGGSQPGASGPAKGHGHAAEHMPFLGTAQSTVSASELVDHGANAWVSFAIAPGFALNGGVARSIPFHLTTASVGLSFDVGRLLFR